MGDQRDYGDEHDVPSCGCSHDKTCQGHRPNVGRLWHCGHPPRDFGRNLKDPDMAWKLSEFDSAFLSGLRIEPV